MKFALQKAFFDQKFDIFVPQGKGAVAIPAPLTQTPMLILETLFYT